MINDYIQNISKINTLSTLHPNLLHILYAIVRPILLSTKLGMLESKLPVALSFFYFEILNSIWKFCTRNTYFT